MEKAKKETQTQEAEKRNKEKKSEKWYKVVTLYRLYP